MDFNQYQKEASKTRIAKYDPPFVYSALGLAGESGEVAEKIKKILRDDDGIVSGEKKEEIKKELGDVLWYLSQLSADFGIEFSDIAVSNLEKIRSRKERGQTKGSGDNR